MEHWTGEVTEHVSGLMVRSRGSNTLPLMVMAKDEPHGALSATTDATGIFGSVVCD